MRYAVFLAANTLPCILISEPEPSDTMRGQHLLELRRLEYQEREREREAQLRMKEIQLKEKEIAMQLKLCELETYPTVLHLYPL